MKDYSFKINGNQYTVGVEIKDEKSAEVLVNGTRYNVELDNATVKKAVAIKPQVAAAPASHPVKNAASPSKANAGESPVLSPLPGVVLSLNVKEGETVTAGQTLLILEAMKMENEINATQAGVVKSIKVNCSDSVLEGDVLIVIE